MKKDIDKISMGVIFSRDNKTLIMVVPFYSNFRVTDMRRGYIYLVFNFQYVFFKYIICFIVVQLICITEIKKK